MGLIQPDLDAAVDELERRGLDTGERFGFPHGPCVEFRAPGGQRIAVYELTRPPDQPTATSDICVSRTLLPDGSRKDESIP